jgi:hypothetical protein
VANLSHRTVSASGKHEISRFFESSLIIGFACRLVNHLMPRLGQLSDEVSLGMLPPAGLRIVHQCDSHGQSLKIRSANYSAKTKAARVSCCYKDASFDFTAFVKSN